MLARLETVSPRPLDLSPTMSGQPHRNFAVRKFLGFAARPELKAKFSGWVNVISVALRTPLCINAERLARPLGADAPLRRTWRLFQGIFDRKIAVRLARHCRRQVERRNDLRLLCFHNEFYLQRDRSTARREARW